MNGSLITFKNPKNDISLNVLKYIAIAAMLIDHIAITFVDDTTVLFNIMDLLGRITGPIMFFAAVEGYHHTRNFKKYLLRLAVFALISYFPFMYLFADGFRLLRFNIIFNILLGLLAIHVSRTAKNIFLKVLLIFALLIISVPSDYGTLCIIIMLVFDFFYGNLKNQLAGYLMIVLFEINILEFFIRPFRALIYTGTFDISFLAEEYSDFGFLIPFFLLCFYKGRKGSGGKFSKWIFYVFYPAHLIILLILKTVLA